MRHADLLRDALTPGIESFAALEEEIQYGDADLDIATEAMELEALFSLRDVATLAMESPGDNFKMAVVIAAALEQYGERVEVDPKDQDAFVAATMESLGKAIMTRLKSMKNRMQNFMGHMKMRRKTIMAYLNKNAADVKAAVSSEPRSFTMTNGTAVNVAIGTQFNDSTVNELQQSLKALARLTDYVASQDSTLKSIASLSRSKASLSAVDLAKIMRGNLIIEQVPEIKTLVLPGNRVITNAKGMHPSFSKPSGDGMRWLGEATDASGHFFPSRLKKVKTATGQVTISPASQQKLAEIAKALPSILSRADNVLEFVSDRVYSIYGDHTSYDSQGNVRRDTGNAFMAEDGIIVGYMQTLWNTVEGVYDITKRLSLGVRQVMTNK